MKNFDEQRDQKPRRPVEDRTFVLGGETFVARDRFRPDVLAPMDSLKDATFDHLTCACDHGLVEHPGRGKCAAANCDCVKFRAKMTAPGATLGEQLAVLDQTIIDMIEPLDGAEERFLAVRASVTNPVELDDLMSVIKWMTEADTGRPTGPSAGSTPPPPADATTSTDNSSSPVSLAV